MFNSNFESSAEISSGADRIKSLSEKKDEFKKNELEKISDLLCQTRSVYEKMTIDFNKSDFYSEN
jgi:hypothetical protein